MVATVKSPPCVLTVLGDVLQHGEEGEGHDEVEGPVDHGGDGVARASRPHGVDLRVDRPRHWAEACTQRYHGNGQWSNYVSRVHTG